MNFWVTIKKKKKRKKKLNERGKKKLNAKFECHLAGPHAFSHEVFERERHFVTTFILQYSSKKFFLLFS